MTKRDFWNRYLRAYDTLNEFGAYRSSMEHVANRLEIQPGDRVLDAGSGTGNLAIRMRERGARVIGLDFSPVALQIHKGKDPSALVLQSSLEDPLPFVSAVFDRIACLSVLFAISRKGARQALSEFKRVLKPGGTLVITAMKPGQSKLGAFWKHIRTRAQSQPARDFLQEMRQTLHPLLRVLYYNYRMYGLSRQDGYRRFTAQELVTEVSGTGFVQICHESTYGDRFHLVAAKTSSEMPEHSAALPASADVTAASGKPRSALAWQPQHDILTAR